MSKFVVSSFVVLSLLLIHGCAAKSKFEPAPPSPYLNIPGVDRNAKLANVPFDHSWVREGFDIDSYSKVIIRPVQTKYVNTANWMESVSGIVTSEANYKKEVDALAALTAEKFKEAFSKTEANRFRVANKPDGGTLAIELALTEVVFGKPVTNAAALASPIPGTSAAVSAVTDPRVAFEAKVFDASTGQLIATAADRASSTARVINLNKFTATSACNDIVENWADLFVQVFNDAEVTKVSRKRFEIKPW